MARLVLAMLLCAAAPAWAQAPLKVMSFNIRFANPADGVNAWDNRREVTAAMLERTAPDLIGTQELLKVQGDFLVSRLKGYAWFGVGRRGGDDDEHMGIFYRTDRLRLLKSGNFWLSDKPDEQGSMAWGADLPRLATWGLFETVDGKRRFYAFNTHLPHREQDEGAREKGAALVLARIKAMAGDLPVVLTGDFNTVPGSPTYRTLSAHMQDAWTSAPKRGGPDKTFHGFTGNAVKRIDWIFTRQFVAKRVETVTDHQGEVQTSDHFPVLAELGWVKR
ncbi:endonuclease/exonuclease/phosphatase family protein [Sphingomonas psychrotolerans]|uniref:Endonuclease/exonuclease/phosphatase family protein n=1 Tax=Sphingomonas psychrotolerans TaxID=1327635 RepID=A0ABU3N4T3_9SPHN|nr:endonuclease/exonuclease/phosphatase family protein [Sphingomonas psychrotolerans]MDT8758874.1 endonuclease/exonuclease/phosphatase family protein [Sphingomonas psychrotolerans]